MHALDFSGRGAPVKGLCEAFVSGAPPHAILLLGAAGVGKRTIARTLLQTLFCTGGGEKPCGECPGCQRYEAGTHPDIHCLPEQKRVGVDAVRELIAALQAAPYEGGYRAALIELAGNMTAQAQNCLLKTLEEPPPKTVFILTALSGAQMLPTIRSRCRLVQVPPFPQAAVEAELVRRGLEAGRAQALAALAQGSLGQAIEMDTDEAFWRLRERLYGALEAVRRPGDVLAALGTLKDDKAEAGRACDLMENALRGALVTTLTGQGLQATGWPALLAQLPARTITTQLMRLTEMRRMLASNVTWQAALERFLLDYAEDIQGWQS